MARRGLMVTATLAAAALLGAQGLPLATADGPGTTTYVVRPGLLPSNVPSWGIDSLACAPSHDTISADVGVEVLNPNVTRGPGTPPLGNSTWGYDVPSPAAVGPFQRVASMKDLAEDQMQVYSDSGTAEGAAWAEVDLGSDTNWFGEAPLTATQGYWQTVQGGGDTVYTWDQVRTDATFTGTIADLLTHIGVDDAPGMVALGFGCNTPGLVHFDDARFGDTGDVSVYDYEGYGATSTSISTSSGQTTAGRPVTLFGQVKDLQAGGFGSGPLVLQRRAMGSKKWVSVATTWPGGPTASSALRVRPVRRTSYRWHRPRTQAADGSTSPRLTIRVHTAIRAHAPTRVDRAARVRVTGRTLPAKPGTRVTLWHGDHRVAASRVVHRGRYILVTKATFPGILRLVVRIGKSVGNLNGHSRTLVVHVR